MTIGDVNDIFPVGVRLNVKIKMPVRGLNSLDVGKNKGRLFQQRKH